MMKKRLLSTLLVLCMVLALLPVTALAAEDSGTCGNGVTWSYSNGTLTIQGRGPMEDYTAPVTGGYAIHGKPWEAYAGQIHTVNIGNGVTKIGGGAFYLCSNLSSVTIPNSVTTIGMYAFSMCTGLTSVVIPNGVKTIEDEAFGLCRGLASVVIPDSVTTISKYAFIDCESLTSVTIPGGVTTIEDATFQGCRSLTSVTIGDGITTIKDSAFGLCEGLTSLTIPDSVTTIGRYAFSLSSQLKDVYYGGSESQWKRIVINEGNESLDTAAIHYKISEPEQPAAPNTPAVKAVLSPQKLTVNGQNVNCEKYNIGGSNYFKLRDLAYVLSGTAARFEVGYNAASSTVSVTTGAAYTPAGGELAAGVDNSSTAQPSSQAVLIDGVRHGELTVYNIGGSNFFQLRELGDILGFEVGYDQTTDTAIIRTADQVRQSQEQTQSQPEMPTAEEIEAHLKETDPGYYRDETGTHQSAAIGNDKVGLN